MQFKQLSWIYNLYSTIKSGRRYFKEKKFIYPVFVENDDLKHILEKYLKCELHRDWIDRLYGVFNPNLDKDGAFDVNTVIIEYKNDSTDNDEYVRHVIMKQLITIRSLFDMYNLFDYLSIDIEHVGPEEHDNYLMIFSMDSKNIFIENLKRLAIHTIIYLTIAGIALPFLLF